MRFRKWLLLTAITLTPAAGNAQSYPAPHFADVTLSVVGSLQSALAAIDTSLAGAQQRSAPYTITSGSINGYPVAQIGPVSSAATGGINPLTIGSPLFNWGSGMPGQTINIANPLGLYLPDSPIIESVPMTYGTEDRAVAVSFIANPAANTALTNNSNPSIMGTIAEGPSRAALYGGRDSVTEFVANTLPPPFFEDPAGTFNTTTYFPSSGHVPSATILAQLRVGMWIDVGYSNQATKYSGQITGWASNGSSISVSGWYQIGNQAAGQTPPNGSAVLVNPVTGIEAINATTTVNATSQMQSSVVAEFDVYNNTGADDILGSASGEAGMSIVSAGGNVASTAFTAAGNWLEGYAAGANGHASFAGFAYGPGGNHGESAFFANMDGTSSGMLLRDAPAGGTGDTVDISPSGNAVFAGLGSFAGAVTAASFSATGAINGASGGFTNLGISGTLTLGTIVSSGPASFSGSVGFTGAVTAGAITAANISVTGTLRTPTAAAPSGACASAGAIEVDPSGSKLYACPSSGGVWKYVALTTN